MKTNDYVFGTWINHTNRTYNATARSLSKNLHWKLNRDTGLYSTEGSLGLHIQIDGLDKDQAHFEKQAFFNTMDRYGYKKSQNLGTEL